MADRTVEERLAALEAKVEESERWRMGAEVNFDRIDGEIDYIDDSLTCRIASIEDRS